MTSARRAAVRRAAISGCASPPLATPRRRVMHDQVAELEARTVKLSNPQKLLFPAAGLTKADLIDYYRRVAPVMLPHLAGRPLSFERYPEGIAAEGFMQKNASDYFPSWIRRVRLAKQDGVVDHVVAEDAGCPDLPGQPGLHHLSCLAIADRSGRSSRPYGARSGSIRRRLCQGQAGGARSPGAARGARPRAVPPGHRLARPPYLGAARPFRRLRSGARVRLRGCGTAGRARGPGN